MPLVTRHSLFVTARPRRAAISVICYLLSVICYLLSASLCVATDSVPYSMIVSPEGRAIPVPQHPMDENALLLTLSVKTDPEDAINHVQEFMWYLDGYYYRSTTNDPGSKTSTLPLTWKDLKNLIGQNVRFSVKSYYSYDGICSTNENGNKVDMDILSGGYILSLSANIDMLFIDTLNPENNRIELEANVDPGAAISDIDNFYWMANDVVITNTSESVCVLTQAQFPDLFTAGKTAIFNVKTFDPVCTEGWVYGPGSGVQVRMMATTVFQEPPSVSNVVARQRWPWNGLVDVDYVVGGSTNLLAGLEARISFAASDGRSWVATNFLAGAEPSAAPGRHRATWDTAADGATNIVAEAVVATVELVERASVVVDDAVFHATIAAFGMAGTAIEADTTPVLADAGPDVPLVKWAAGDTIRIRNGNGDSAVFTLESGAGTTNAAFTCADGFEMVPPFVAVYPSTAAINDDGTVTFAVPAVQSAAQTGAFANGATPMVACASDDNLRFANLCGGLCVPLYGNGAHVTRITIEDPLDRINGEFKAESQNPDDQPDFASAGTKLVTLACDAMLPASANESVAFFAALPQGTLRSGVAVTIYDGNYKIGEIHVLEGDSAQATRNLIKYFAPVEITMFDIYEEVDLGLPSSLRWATCNIGANTPEEYGDYIAWAEAFPKAEYTSANYSFGSYNPTVLEPANDAATIRWSYGWRMPTKEEWEELYNNTTVTWAQENGVNGRLFTANNGNTLFLPAAGYYNGSSLYDEGIYGEYWSSSLYSDNSTMAWKLFFNSDNRYTSSSIRYMGLSVRAVRPAH